jgi:hypothetical protein
MNFLGDYVGQLMAEMTIARMQADLETVRLAELYAEHPLLRTMPIPHFRLPDVELDIPVLIKAVEDPRPGESARGGISPQELRKAFDRVLKIHMTRAQIELSPADTRTLRAALDERIAALGAPAETSIDVRRTADDLTTTAARVLGELKGQDAGERALTEAAEMALKEAVRLEFLKMRPAPPRVTALVTTAEMRELATAENVTRVRLKVTEQGVEWATVDADGVSRERLVPE